MLQRNSSVCGPPASQNLTARGLFRVLRRAAIAIAVVPLGASLAYAPAACTGWRAALDQLGRDAYPLDGIDRQISSADGGRGCPEVARATYAGDAFRFHPPADVAHPFAERLRRFERVVVDLAQTRYGRAPKRVLHAGAYVCRAIQHRAGRFSEHALGNAIDIVGFDFDALPKCAEQAPSVAPALCSALKIRVVQHWEAADGPVGREHSEFLRELAERLAAESVFRSLIGPADPAHATHLHLDMAPYSYVKL